jgi:outer membrane protein assembly factor BamB/orotate phosphoribosyltransferase
MRRRQGISNCLGIPRDNVEPDRAQEERLMKYFKLIRSGINVAPLLEEVRSQEQAWLIDTSRQDKIRVQRDTNTIFISAAVQRPDLHVNENQETRLTSSSKLFPRALGFMTEFAQEMNCQLSRATIVRLKPQSRVSRHIDEGSYYFLRDRFHLVLQSSTGSVLMSGGEQVRMQEGELWWFDNKQYHESYNESDDWRIHYIFDLLPADYSDLAVNPIFLPPEPLHSPKLAESVLSGDKPLEKGPAPSGPRDLLSAAIRERAILHEENQRLISPKGNSNRWLIDMRRVFMDARLLDAAAELFWQECAGRMPFQVGGMESAAIPFLSAILMKSLSRGAPVNGFIVRKERKTYGTGSSIEGALMEAPIVMVDDVFNSGRNLEKARVVLEQENKRIGFAFVLIDYDNPEGKLWRQMRDVPVLAPFSLVEFGVSIEKPEVRPMAVFENIWRFASPDPNFFHRVPKSFPAVDGKRVYFGSDCGIFWCLNACDGAVVWNFKVNVRGNKNLWSSPAIHGGKVYFGSYDGNVYCLDAETGTELWRFIGADWVGSSPALAPELDLLFIGLEFAVEGRRGSVAALKMSNGEKVWEHMTKRYTHASPAYWPERQLVACGSNDNEMFLFDARSGVMQWRFVTKGEGGSKGSIRHAPAFDTKRGHLVTGCADGWVYIINVETGKEVWSVKTDNTIYTVPLVVDDRAYIGSTDKHLYVLDLERRGVKKKIFAAAKVFGPPKLLDGRIYFGACNGIIYEVDPATDEISGTHQLPDAVTNALSYSAETGYFYASTYVNELFAFARRGTR